LPVSVPPKSHDIQGKHTYEDAAVCTQRNEDSHPRSGYTPESHRHEKPICRRSLKKSLARHFQSITSGEDFFRPCTSPCCSLTYAIVNVQTPSPAKPEGKTILSRSANAPRGELRHGGRRNCVRFVSWLKKTSSGQRVTKATLPRIPKTRKRQSEEIKYVRRLFSKPKKKVEDSGFEPLTY